MARLGRLGLGARGVLYVLLAYLALRVAFGQPASGADRHGALHTVDRQPATWFQRTTPKPMPRHERTSSFDTANPGGCTVSVRSGVGASRYPIV